MCIRDRYNSKRRNILYRAISNTTCIDSHHKINCKWYKFHFHMYHINYPSYLLNRCWPFLMLRAVTNTATRRTEYTVTVLIEFAAVCTYCLREYLRWHLCSLIPHSYYTRLTGRIFLREAFLTPFNMMKLAVFVTTQITYSDTSSDDLEVSLRFLRLLLHHNPSSASEVHTKNS